MYLRAFYILSIIGLFSLLLFSSDQTLLITPTTVIYVIATFFAGLYCRELTKTKKLPKFEKFIYLLAPIGLPISVFYVRYIAM